MAAHSPRWSCASSGPATSGSPWRAAQVAVTLAVLGVSVWLLLLMVAEPLHHLGRFGA
jgi:hypothetical protein